MSDDMNSTERNESKIVYSNHTILIEGMRKGTIKWNEVSGKISSGTNKCQGMFHCKRPKCQGRFYGKKIKFSRKRIALKWWKTK